MPQIWPQPRINWPHEAVSGWFGLACVGDGGRNVWVQGGHTASRQEEAWKGRGSPAPQATKAQLQRQQQQCSCCFFCNSFLLLFATPESRTSTTSLVSHQDRLAQCAVTPSTYHFPGWMFSLYVNTLCVFMHFLLFLSLHLALLSKAKPPD